MTGWNLPPGCTDAHIDRAANGDEANTVQCDNCQKMFHPDDEDCFIGWHQSYGDCCQCGKCVEKARAEAGFMDFMVRARPSVRN